ncbi:hypothetical protein FB45DRAFT_918281 [Roridomyces roridus]|uniref:Uncharacterized protein n=1 Tax=Roridomyces roridus TaxID=1738132 RepID=A0AAD7BR00_9AGAR|nr:hypothetical protein FB45DRAFT_918281 [Roridomyces roridus]
MAKRERVPASLHHELTEYSSLLRALQFNDPLEVANDIAREPPRKRARLNKDGSQPVEQEEAAPQPDEAEPAKRRHRKRKRDTWTRWPLLVNDITVPEWGLADELEALVRASLKERESPDDDDDDLDPSYLPHVTQSASNFLSAVLALIANHTPPRPQSMQERINPIGWQTVLAILGSCCDDSLIDATMLSNVRARMEAMNGPGQEDDGRAAVRVQARRAVKARTAEALHAADDALLSFTGPPKRQPKPRTAVVEDDVDSDDLDE